jgi:Predicted pPIWI-associating nuclease
MMDSNSTLEERLSTLKPKALDVFSRLAIDGARHALADCDNPLRLNFFSAAMRILFEHIMDTLAPLDQVQRSSWFVPQKENGSPTRGQRVVFAVQGGLADAFVKDRLNVDTAPLRKKLLRGVDNFSKHVHGRADTIISGMAEQDSEAHAAIDALLNFMETYHECRSAIVDPIQRGLDAAAVDALISETIQEIDELASHHSIEEVYVDRPFIKIIGPDTIVFSVEGSIEVVLQWGSNSDVRRGDGAEIDQTFPFHCEIEVPLEDPWDLSLAETAFLSIPANGETQWSQTTMIDT